MLTVGRPKTISEIIDRLDAIREELTSIQRRLEKMERVEAPQPPPSKGQKPNAED
jgi:hypothetical protein